MEDRNKDLPLIVSEILIEMHEMKVDMREMRGDIGEMRGDIGEMRGDIGEMRGDIRQLAGSINIMVEENRKNTEMMVSVLNRYADMMNRRLDDHDDRITKLENN